MSGAAGGCWRGRLWRLLGDLPRGRLLGRYVIRNQSMAPSLIPGDRFLAVAMGLWAAVPRRGDVVVLAPGSSRTSFTVKRVVGLPGETVSIDGVHVTIVDNAGVAHMLIEPYISSSNPKKQNSIIALAKDEYFVLGDNRDESSDSREWGPLQDKFIIGRALLSIYPFDHVGFLPGKYRL